MHPRNSRYCVICGHELAEGHKCPCREETVRDAWIRIKRVEFGIESERTCDDRLAEAKAQAMMEVE